MRGILHASVFAAILGSMSFAPGTAAADLIAYTQTAVVSGTLGGSSFTNALLTITLTADTTQVTGSTPYFSVEPIENQFTIAGVGGGSITEPTLSAYVNQAYSPPAAGFGANGTILATLNPVFATYDLKTAFALTSGTAFIRSDLTFATSAGGLNLIGVLGNATFQASLVPEPASLALIGIGLLGIGFIARRAPGHRQPA